VFCVLWLAVLVRDDLSGVVKCCGVVNFCAKMTTAARPTFEPARGGQGRNEKDLSAISRQYSSRDLPGHTKLKYREHGQGTVEEVRSRDFRKELEERERDSKGSRGPRTSDHKRLKLDQVPAASLDADDPLDEEDSDSSDSEDDMESLLAELNKIKKERAMDQAKKEIEKRQEEERIRMENILSGNPLLTHYSAGAAKTDHKVKRRWDDDVVFKNCARSEPEKKTSVFINDSLRSDFHKKFMEKYVK
jgi:protein CWC15